jgi:prepilin-type N-terminal cleavage/methylation domain-containing protein
VRIALRARRGDRGFTLVEVLVAISILAVVLSLATGLIIRALDQNSNLTQETDAQNRNNTGMEQLTRLLRQAVFPSGGTNKTSSIISSATANSITFTTRLATATDAASSAFNTPIQQVTATFNTTTHKLVWGTGAQSASCSGICTYATPTLNKTLVYGLRNDGGSTVCPANTSGNTAVFQYWYTDSTGNLASWPIGGAVSTELISVVQIRLWTQTQVGPQRPACVNLTDYVQLRNWQ